MNGWSADVILGLLIPFAGTAAGSACVFFMRKNLKQSVQRALTGFAGGVMVAASIWSLLIPAMQQAEGMGKWGNGLSCRRRPASGSAVCFSCCWIR